MQIEECGGGYISHGTLRGPECETKRVLKDFHGPEGWPWKAADALAASSLQHHAKPISLALFTAKYKARMIAFPFYLLSTSLFLN
jgi:hypothetical protein